MHNTNPLQPFYDTLTIGIFGIFGLMLLVFGCGMIFLLVRRRIRNAYYDHINTRVVDRATTIDDILTMDPYQFEHLCRMLFENQGFNVRITARCNDGGVDLVVAKDGVTSVVQCKRHTQKPVGRPTLQQLYGTYQDNNATHGYFITTSSFTGPAMEFVDNKNMTLIDGSTLTKWLNLYAGGNIQPTRTTSWNATCATCGGEAILPFKPTKSKPVYCKSCCAKRYRRAS